MKMIFWSYDQFPYVLWGISKNKPDKEGLFFVDSYCARFKPILVLPLVEGQALADKISDITQDYKKLKDLAHKISFERLANAFPQIKS